MASLLLFASFFQTSIAQSPPCFWPNGNVAQDYEPCPNTSVCCFVGEACLSNRLCYGAKYNIAYRGACTDQTWPEDECPHICHTEIAGGWANIYPCPGNPNQVMTCGAAGWVTGFCEANLSTCRGTCRRGTSL
ncbi:hypothetical protein BJY04DRAFT_201425 [Aspergillus karnatakaensis]|uniref:uncharacterized protein n=1 Tax=Aspergillus karnatakaensis TaxID=1810916 RepID=UPI003CCD7416